jgi:pseudouridine-5'-phosphate glycosidase
MHSHLRAGLQRSQLEHIARKGAAVRKVSRRDLPLVMARGADGATTVSATMLLAARAGIRVFVTGGIGGVHRRALRHGTWAGTHFGRNSFGLVLHEGTRIVWLP